jgi:hypothetical protein
VHILYLGSLLEEIITERNGCYHQDDQQNPLHIFTV